MYKRSLIIGLVCLAVAVVAIAVLFTQNRTSYKYVRGYYDANNMYTCSKPLKAHYQKVALPDSSRRYAHEYVPVSLSDARRYCHVSGVF